MQFLYGFALYQGNRLSEAAPALAKALELNPRDDRAAYYLGLTKESLGQPDDAVPLYERAIRLKPPANDLAAWIRLENLDIALGPGVEPAYELNPNAGGCAIAIDGSGSTAHGDAVQRAIVRNLRLHGWACGVWLWRHVNTLLERVVVEHWRRGTKSAGGTYVGFSFACDAVASPPGAGISPQASLEVVQCLFNGDGAPPGVRSIGFHVHGEIGRAHV